MNFDPITALNILIAGALGGAVSWAITAYYAYKSTKELESLRLAVIDGKATITDESGKEVPLKNLSAVSGAAMALLLSTVFLSTMGRDDPPAEPDADKAPTA